MFRHRVATAASCCLAGLLSGCGPEALKPIPEPPGPKVLEVHLADVGLDAAAMDRKVDPCSDFYHFACGGWEKTTEIPADKPRWSRSFEEINKRNLEALRQILDAEVAKQPGVVPNQLADFYAACMDEDAIEAAGLSGVQPLWDAAGNVRANKLDDPPAPPTGPKEPDNTLGKRGKKRKPPEPVPPPAPNPPPPPPRAALVDVIGRLHQAGVYVFFDIDSGQDFKDATKMIAHIDQNGLGLPDRDFYLDSTDERKAIREFYREHVARMLTLAGYTPEEAKVAADDVIRVETELATAQKSKVERRDPAGMYNRVDRTGLRERSTGLTWDDYFKERQLDGVNEISVTSVPYVEALGKTLADLKQSELTHYLQWHVIHTYAMHLPKRFVDEAFTLEQRLSGQGELEPRWKRCVKAADASLGELLAQPFVHTHFSDESKAAVVSMLGAIGDAFREDVHELHWMTDATREKAVEKLDRMAHLIGFPDAWKTYDFGVGRGTYTANVVHATAFDIQRELAKIGKPVDRGEWDMTPPTVNAYYTPLKNQMVFPAGILQPPFFQPKAGVAVNLGGIGMVIGHELTHGFDDKGSQFDAAGNLQNWWEPEVRDKFDQRTACMAAQYDGYEVLPGVHLNGKQTLGENIADAGGVKLAFHAYRAMRENAPEVYVADGFSEDQQFFLSVGQVWCSKYRDEFAKTRATTDYHSQPIWRVNGSLANTPEFAETFQCEAGKPMHPKKPCNVW